MTAPNANPERTRPSRSACVESVSQRRLVRAAQAECWANFHVMKIFIIFLFSCAGLFGAETGIRVVSMGQTNVGYMGVYAKDVFTRDGQTNLIHITKIDATGAVLQIYHFYHAGQLVGNFVAFPDDHTFNTEAAPYCMSLKFGPTGEIRSARIGDKDRSEEHTSELQ